jgi:hypothetical protein
MPRLITPTAIAVALALVAGACGPSGDRAYREPADSGRASVNATPTRDVRPDSTTGVARSSGRPGVAGDTLARSSSVSKPRGKSTRP